MHPEVVQDGPGSCPDCGMALEPVMPTQARTQYTCPMHPEIVRDAPGSCPICGMALEPVDAGARRTNPELVDMTRRFWIGLALTLPVFALAMGEMIPGDPIAARARLDGPHLDPARARDAGRALGRLAVLRARRRLAVARCTSTCSR